jgi:hypothetical protein
MGQRVRDDDVINFVVGIGFGFLSLLSFGAGIAMIRQRFYSLALAGSISMILWSIFCCFFPLPVAIWNLVVLTRAGTRQQFS